MAIAEKRGRAPRVTEIADRVKLSISVVYAAIHVLEKTGHVDREPGFNNSYRFVVEEQKAAKA